MPSTYLDIYSYIRMPNGIAGLSGYYANAFRLTSAFAANAAQLRVPSTAVTTPLNPYDTLSIFDGANSEQVQVSTVTATGATTIPLLSPTLYAHAAGTPVCSDGALGSLAQQIFTASAWVEDICRQSLFSATYADEVLSMPTPRAALDNQGGLSLRPLHFPVTALSAFSIRVGSSTSTISYDASQATIDSLKRIVSVPILVPLAVSQQSQLLGWDRQLTRSARATLTITYTAGWTAIPFPVQRACSLLVNQCFVELTNSVGADQAQEGKRNITYTLRGDQSGESLLVKQATKLLELYTLREA